MNKEEFDRELKLLMARASSMVSHKGEAYEADQQLDAVLSAAAIAENMPYEKFATCAIMKHMVVLARMDWDYEILEPEDWRERITDIIVYLTFILGHPRPTRKKLDPTPTEE